MPTAEDLRVLKARVDAATGPDRALDDDLWMSLCWQDHFREIARGTLAFTASLDAALALVERVLPGERVVIETRCEDWKRSYASVGSSWSSTAVGEWGSTPALAVLATLLTTLIAREEEAAHAD